MPQAETLLFIRAIICQPGVAGILFKTSRAYITRAREEVAGERGSGGRERVAVVAWQAFITAATYLLT